MFNNEIIGEVVSPEAPDFGLGRVPSFDIRDTEFRMQSILPPLTALVNIRYKYWYSSGYYGDQGSTPQCVGYSWANFLESSPITHPDKLKSAVVDPSLIYKMAQERDEWPGSGYDGSSVRGGVKALVDLGRIESYYWGWTIEDVVAALLSKGPVVVGTNWYSGMFSPNSAHIIWVTGNAVGGHAYLLDGINLDNIGREIRIKNSWGKNWGNNGYAYISIEDMRRLLSEYGEACIAIEKKP